MDIQRNVDSVPVRKIYIREGRINYEGLPILEYLSQFGEVVMSGIVPNYETGDSVVMFTFARAEYANKCLCSKMNKTPPFAFMPAFTWYQPDVIFPKVPSSISYTITDSSLIQSLLNEDCLEKIFDYLNIFQIFEIENICKKFKKAAALSYKNVYPYLPHFDVTTYMDDKEIDQISLHKFRSLLIRFSHKMESLALDVDVFISGETDDLCLMITSLVDRYCPNLKELTINKTYFYKEKMQSNFRDYLINIHKSKNLRHVNDMQLTDDLNSLRCKRQEQDLEECLLYYKNLDGMNLNNARIDPHYVSVCLSNNTKTLTRLAIIEFENFTNDLVLKINNLQCLTSLTIDHGYRNVPQKRFAEMIARQNLNTLEIFYNERLKDYGDDHDVNSLLQEMSLFYKDNTSLLEFLTLIDCPVTEETCNLIAEIKSIKNLGIHNCCDDLSYLLELLHSSQLYRVDFIKCTGIAEESVLELLRKCSTIFKISVAGCKNITNKFVRQFAKDITTSGMESKYLVVNLSDTRVTEIDIPEISESNAYITILPERINHFLRS